jgi:hypothetical protein
VEPLGSGAIKPRGVFSVPVGDVAGIATGSTGRNPAGWQISISTTDRELLSRWAANGLGV